MKDKTILEKLTKSISAFLSKNQNVKLVGSSILKTKTEEATPEESGKIIGELQETLLNYRKHTNLGRGLAAPQIGISKSIFVTYVDDAFKTYINPKIIYSSEEKNIYRELCISCETTSAEVIRSKSITIEYLSGDGVATSEHADGFLARLLQHEYDHLRGILNLDIAETGSIELVLGDPLKEELRDVH